jgi:hypothetical protein
VRIGDRGEQFADALLEGFGHFQARNCRTAIVA